MSLRDELADAVAATCDECGRQFLTSEAESAHECDGAGEAVQVELSTFGFGGESA